MLVRQTPTRSAPRLAARFVNRAARDRFGPPLTAEGARASLQMLSEQAIQLKRSARTVVVKTVQQVRLISETCVHTSQMQ